MKTTKKTTVNTIEIKRSTTYSFKETFSDSILHDIFFGLRLVNGEKQNKSFNTYGTNSLKIQLIARNGVVISEFEQRIVVSTQVQTVDYLIALNGLTRTMLTNQKIRVLFCKE